jgi:hypothetical protein
MFFSSFLVYIRHPTTSSAARYIILVVTNFDTAPGVFVVGIRSRDYEICSESCCGEAWCTLDLWHLTLDIADASKIDKVKRIL